MKAPSERPETPEQLVKRITEAVVGDATEITVAQAREITFLVAHELRLRREGGRS